MTRLMSFWVRPTVAANSAVVAPMKARRRARRRVLEQRRAAGDHEHAGGDHGRGMDQGRDRRRALHGVGQPGVQRQLRRLAHGADEQQEADHGRACRSSRRGHQKLGVDELGGAREHDVELDRVEHEEDREDAEREAEIADPVDQERLDRRGVGGGRVYQKPIKRYETRPTPSQPKNSCRKLSAVTSISMKKVNSVR